MRYVIMYKIYGSSSTRMKMRSDVTDLNTFIQQVKALPSFNKICYVFQEVKYE